MHYQAALLFLRHKDKVFVPKQHKQRSQRNEKIKRQMQLCKSH